MPTASRTAPFDIVLSLRLLQPAGTLVQLAEELTAVPSQVHASLVRLARAGLLRPNARATNARALGEFVIHGVRYAFPAQRGELTVGVPTAYSAPPLSSDFDATDVLVWAAPRHAGAVQGFSVVPLYPGAITLAERSPATYLLVAMVDALRIGDPRVRLVARQRLERALGLRGDDGA